VSSLGDKLDQWLAAFVHSVAGVLRDDELDAILSQVPVD
jgi:hypothetical protein